MHAFVSLRVCSMYVCLKGYGGGRDREREMKLAPSIPESRWGK